MRSTFNALLSVAVATLVLLNPRPAQAQDDLGIIGGLPGGSLGSRTCPDEAVMTGLRARVGMMVDAIGIRCRRIKADGTLGSEFNDGSMLGGTGGTERIRSCPTGTVIVGQRLGAMLTMLGLIRVGFYCRAWSPRTRSTSGSAALVDVVTSVTSGLREYTDMCASSLRPVRRLRARTGTIVNAAGLTCLSP